MNFSKTILLSAIKKLVCQNKPGDLLKIDNKGHDFKGFCQKKKIEELYLTISKKPGVLQGRIVKDQR